jgi:formyltetrahydrofolate deformylase
MDPAAVSGGLASLAQQLGMEIKLRWLEPNRLQRMAVFVTREAHCAEALFARLNWRRLKVQPVVMISNRRDLQAMSRRFKLPFVFIPWHDRAKAERRALRVLDESEADFVVLARFMKILSPNFVWRYKNKIINIHPSLLPSFPGPQAYRQAYEHGVKIIGATAHFVSMHLDEGPIIAQASQAIRSNSTLAQIVAAGQKLEAAALVKAVRLYLTRRLDVHWGVVKEL